MRVLLQRNYFCGGARYRADPNGTELPADSPLPSGAKVWNGKEFVAPPATVKADEALRVKAQRAVEAEEAAPKATK